MSEQDALATARITREVQLEMRDRFPEVIWPEPVLEPIYYGRFDKNRIENRKLMMDANTGIQFDVVSDRYELIPHEVAAYNLLKSIPEEFGTPEIKIRLWQGGARFRIEANFPEIGNFEIKPGDPVQPKVIQSNSLDRSMNYAPEFGAVELVCTNGLIAYKQRMTAKRRHVYGAEDIDTLSVGMQAEMENFSDQVGIWQSWHQQRLEDLSEAELVLEEMPFSDTERNKLLLLPLMNYDGKTLKGLAEDKAVTLWAVNSAATQFAAHEVHSEQRAFELERKIATSVSKFAQAAAA